MCADNVKPGDVIQTIHNTSRYIKNVKIYVFESFDDFSRGVYPKIAKINEKSVGFVVSLSDRPAFDWMIEVSFPEENVQGWVSKFDISIINPLIPVGPVNQD